MSWLHTVHCTGLLILLEKWVWCSLRLFEWASIESDYFTSKYFLFHFHFCRNGSSRDVEVLSFCLMWLYVIKLICPSVAKRHCFNFKAFGGEMPSFIQIASTFTKHFLTKLIKVNKYSIYHVLFKLYFRTRLAFQSQYQPPKP